MDAYGTLIIHLTTFAPGPHGQRPRHHSLRREWAITREAAEAYAAEWREANPWAANAPVEITWTPESVSL